MAAATYTAKDIAILEGLEPARKRPGMYIGGVGSAGLHHLVWETLVPIMGAPRLYWKPCR